MKVDHPISDRYPAKNWRERAFKPPELFHFEISREIGLVLQCNDDSGRRDERRLGEDAAVLTVYEDNPVSYRAVGEKALFTRNATEHRLFGTDQLAANRVKHPVDAVLFPGPNDFLATWKSVDLW